MDPVRPPKGPLAGQSTTARSSRHAASPPRSEIVPPRRACTRTPDTVWVRRSRVPASHQRAPLPPGTQPLPRGPLCSRNVRDRAWGKGWVPGGRGALWWLAGTRDLRTQTVSGVRVQARRGGTISERGGDAAWRLDLAVVDWPASGPFGGRTGSISRYRMRRPTTPIRTVH